MTAHLILTRWQDRVHSSLDWQESKVTDEAVKAGRAVRIPVRDNTAEAFGLRGILSLHEAGKL